MQSEDATIDITINTMYGPFATIWLLQHHLLGQIAETVVVAGKIEWVFIAKVYFGALKGTENNII